MAHGINHSNVLSEYRNGSWVMHTLGQYPNYEDPNFWDTCWMPHMKTMIARGDIYVRLFPLSTWANPDVNKDANFSLLKEAGIEVYEPIWREDAQFDTVTEVGLRRLYMTDADTPDDIPLIKARCAGNVEFGTQSMSKSIYALLVGVPLLRIPYQFGACPTPFAALLVNINPKGHSQ